MGHYPDVECELCRAPAVALYDIPESILSVGVISLCPACVFDKEEHLGILIEDLTGGWWTRAYEEEFDVRDR